MASMCQPIVEAWSGTSGAGKYESSITYLLLEG
jgi:hypothetical protein